MSSGTESGAHFGLTSGVVTPLGLLVGLHSGTGSALAVVGGLLTIAIADAMSDALGIHVSKEAEQAPTREVWKATATTFVAKFLMAISFVVPVLLFSLGVAVAVSIVWGLGVLAVVSHRLARAQGSRPLPIIAEHLGSAVLVILVTHRVGVWVAATFPES